MAKTINFNLFKRKIIIKMSNRVLYTLLAMVLVILLGIGIYALAPSIDTSQGYHESDQISVSVSGTEKTLQEAIDDKSLGGIPSGAIMMFSSSCPSVGWTRVTALDDKFVRGATSYGVTGGSDTHSHSTSLSSGPYGSVAGYGYLSITYSGHDYHGGVNPRTLVGSTNEVYNIPAYVTVVFCMKD